MHTCTNTHTHIHTHTHTHNEMRKLDSGFSWGRSIMKRESTSVLWWCLYTFYLQCMPGESYRRWLRSFFCFCFYLCYVFWALIKLLTPLCVDFEKKKALYFVLKDERVEQWGSEFQMLGTKQQQHTQKSAKAMDLAFVLLDLECENQKRSEAYMME